jgi:hypothetical protein
MHIIGRRMKVPPLPTLPSMAGSNVAVRRSHLPVHCAEQVGSYAGHWVEIHRDELMADWALAVEGNIPFKIEPLK